MFIRISDIFSFRTVPEVSPMNPRIVRAVVQFVHNSIAIEIVITSITYAVI